MSSLPMLIWFLIVDLFDLSKFLTVDLIYLILLSVCFYSFSWTYCFYCVTLSVVAGVCMDEVVFQ